MEAIEQAFYEQFPDWERMAQAARKGLLGHARKLLEANQTTNLTALREPARLVRELFLPSWNVGELLDLSQKTVLDLGSGAGFPGIPLALRFPSARFVLCDSIGKKAEFLRSAIEHLALPNARVFAGRGEELLRRERFDVLIAQAVSPTEKLLSLLSPVRGALHWVALMKGRGWANESSEPSERKLGFLRESARPIPSPDPADTRYLLLFRTKER